MPDERESPWPRRIGWTLLIAGIASLSWVVKAEARRDRMAVSTLSQQAEAYRVSIDTLRRIVDEERKAIDRKERLIRAMMLREGWTPEEIARIAAGETAQPEGQ